MVLRFLIVAAATVFALAGSAHPSATGGAEEAYVAAEADDLLVAVNLETGRVVARIPVANGPHNVAVAGDGRFVLVTSPPAGTVTLVDAFSRRVVKVLQGFGYPHDVEVEGEYAYVTDEERGQLAVIHLGTRRVVARVAVGRGPHDVAVGDVAIVTHGPRDPHLTIVDVGRPARPRVIGRLDPRGPAHDISEQPDSANLYLTYWNSGAVAALDAGRRRLLWRRNVGHLVHHVQFDHFNGRRLWATDHHTGLAYLLDSRTGRVLRTLRGCPGAHHVHFGPGRGRVVVACHDAGTLLVLDPVAETTSSIRVGRGPHGVAVAFVP